MSLVCSLDRTGSNANSGSLERISNPENKSTLTYTYMLLDIFYFKYITTLLGNKTKEQREKHFKNDHIKRISKLELNLKQRLVRYFHDTSVRGKQNFLWRERQTNL
jgi:hypothetical protein